MYMRMRACMCVCAKCDASRREHVAAVAADHVRERERILIKLVRARVERETLESIISCGAPSYFAVLAFVSATVCLPILWG